MILHWRRRKMLFCCPDQTRPERVTSQSQARHHSSLSSPLMFGLLFVRNWVVRLNWAPEILNYSWLGSGLHVLQLCMNNDNSNHNYCPSFSSDTFQYSDTQTSHQSPPSLTWEMFWDIHSDVKLNIIMWLHLKRTNMGAECWPYTYSPWKSIQHQKYSPDSRDIWW